MPVGKNENFQGQRSQDNHLPATVVHTSLAVFVAKTWQFEVVTANLRFVVPFSKMPNKLKKT